MQSTLHARISKRGKPRHYAAAVLERYVGRLRITETNPIRWRNWLHGQLLVVARERAWWSRRWELTCMRDLYWLVSEWSVLIDGVRCDIYDAERMESVRALARGAKKYTGALPTLPVRKHARRSAIKAN